MRGARLHFPTLMVLTALLAGPKAKAQDQDTDVLQGARALVKELEQGTREERRQSLGRLARLGPAAIPAVEGAAKSPNADVARSARSLLLAWERYDALREEVIEQTRHVSKAGKVLRASGPVAFDVLVGAYQAGVADNWRLGEAIIQLAAETNPERAIAFFETILAGHNQRMKSRVLYALRKTPAKESVRLAIAAMLSEPGNTGHVAQSVLSKIGEPAVEPLLEVLKDPDPKRRAKAAGAFYEFRYLMDSRKSPLLPRVVEALVRAREDDNPEVQAAAVHSLARLSTERFRESLGHKSAAVRAAAISYLGRMRIRGETETFLSALRDPDPDVRTEAVWALDRTRKPRVVNALSVALTDESAKVRVTAARALSKLAPRSRASKDVSTESYDWPLEKLLVMAHDIGQPEDVRYFASEAVMRSDDPRAYEFARKTLGQKGLTWLATHRLAQSGKSEAADLIATLLADKKWGGSASESLANMGMVAIPALEHALLEGTEVARACALRALENMHTRKVVPLAVRALGDKHADVRKTAARVLGKLGDKRAVEGLARLLSDPDKIVRDVAASSLTMLGDNRAKARAIAFHRTLHLKRGSVFFSTHDSAEFLVRFALRLGMTKNEVAAILGYPRGTTGKADIWFYTTGWSTCVTMTFRGGMLASHSPPHATYVDFFEDE